ncbi:MAG: TRAP transporter small permease [Clostridiales Family XIII bacterium]|jgi:TRAP-type C4-dicarboxylate transport system permease small subunit|nr:TRAP transporter small permease [Clostridiales Family XIII bacterium]
MNKMIRLTDRIATVCAWVGIALILIMMAMYTIDVLGRLVIHQQIKGTFEFAQFMLCIMSFGSYGYTQITRGHIHIGFLTRIFPQKVKYSTYLAGFVLSAMMSVITTYAIWRIGLNAVATHKATSVISLPLGPMYFISAIFMAVFALTIIVDIIRCIRAIAGDAESQESIDSICL